jgi:hypothetical protein
MKNYVVSLLVDSSRKVHYLVRSTSKQAAKLKSTNAEFTINHGMVKKVLTVKIKQ